ncbi:MAG TPA: Mov34/MPN/PAD-1 family protein [Polyangia bacterium]
MAAAGASLPIAPAALAEVGAHAAAAYPAECCGLLLGPRDGPVDTVRPCRNLAGPGAFALGLDDLLFLEASLAGARPARVLYHSHADGPAALSPADERGALLGLDAPAWPLAHLVVEVRRGRAGAAALYRFDPARRAFVLAARADAPRPAARGWAAAPI